MRFSGKSVINVHHKLSSGKALISIRTGESKITFCRIWSGNTQGNLGSAAVSDKLLVLAVLLRSYSGGESCKISDNVRLLLWTAANSITCLLPEVKDCLCTITVWCWAGSQYSVVELGALAEKLGTDLANMGGDRNSYWFHCDLDKV